MLPGGRLAFVDGRAGHDPTNGSALSGETLRISPKTAGTISRGTELSHDAMCITKAAIQAAERFARSIMRMVMKVALAAMGVTVLASPVMAQYRREPWIPVSTDNVFWGLAVGPVIHEGPVYGSIRRIAPGRAVPGPVYGAPPRILDCVHVTFPQCGGPGQ
jgi:hypothetical protein